jgi:outer membrane protein OmpA-like peptidoglycan-associated protein
MPAMRFALLAVLIAAAPAFGQTQEQMDKINKWFAKQTPMGEIATPGAIQTPGELQVPKGIQAIREQAATCETRLQVAAEALFDFDQATLRPDAEETLVVLVPKIKAAGAHPITIEGHTDAKGSDSYNQGLSERRAAAVKVWLVAHDAIPADAATKGYGETRPVAPNNTPDGGDDPVGRQANRRVEVVIDTCQ